MSSVTVVAVAGPDAHQVSLATRSAQARSAAALDTRVRTARSFSRCATDRSFVASRTSGRDPPPTHLADVLDGFVGHFCEQSGLKQLKRSTKKLVLSKTKLDEDIPGGSTAESVPTSDELEHGALIAGPTSRCGLVAVTGTPPTRRCNCVAAPCHLQFPKGKLGTRLVVGCFHRRWAADPPLDSCSCSVGCFRGVGQDPPIHRRSTTAARRPDRARCQARYIATVSTAQDEGVKSVCFVHICSFGERHRREQRSSDGGCGGRGGGRCRTHPGRGTGAGCESAGSR